MHCSTNSAAPLATSPPLATLEELEEDELELGATELDELELGTDELETDELELDETELTTDELELEATELEATELATDELLEDVVPLPPPQAEMAADNSETAPSCSPRAVIVLILWFPICILQCN